MNNCIICKSKTKNKLYCSRDCYNVRRPNMVKRNVIQKQCKLCNIIFETNRASAKFCSESCYQMNRANTNIRLNCGNCGNEFSVSKYRYEKGLVKYCSMKCRNTSDEWINSNIIKNINQLHKIGLNKLELAGRTLLNELNIEFLEQTLVCGKFVVDVLIPDKKIVIQWDGDYWHGNPNFLKNGKPNKLQNKNIEKDIRVNNELTKNGYRVLRFWQSDVDNNPEFVVETIKKIYGNE